MSWNRFVAFLVAAFAPTLALLGRDLPVARLRESDSGIFLEHQEKALALGDWSKEAFSEVFLQTR